MKRKSANKGQLFNIDKYTKATEMLDLIKDKVLELAPEEKVEDDGFDYLTSWQIVSVVVCYLYCELLECYTSAFSSSSSSFSSISSSSTSSLHHTSRSDVIHPKHNTTSNQDNSDISSRKNDENNQIQNIKKNSKHVRFICKSVISLYELLEAILEVLVVRVRYTNPKQIREYFLLLSQLCQIIMKIEKNKIVTDVIKLRSIVKDNTEKSRENCSSLIVELARKIRDAGEFINR